MSKPSGAGAKLNDETNALMSNGPSRAHKKAGFSKFLYNKEKGTCLGRTRMSWAKLTGFYIIFYCFLAAFWIGCLAVFLSTVDKKLPRYYGKGTIIGSNPGVGYQPWIKENPESTLIKFNPRDPSTYEQYVKVLDKYFEKYTETNRTRDCSGDQANSDIIEGDKVANSDGLACRFKLTPFERAGCLKSTDYGFKTGTPCIVVTLNRLIGWKPENYGAGDVPKSVARRYKAGNVAFNCAGLHNVDTEIEGNIEYVPPEGIDSRYYPFAVMDNYHQPIAMVKFRTLPPNRVVMIRCRAIAKNIDPASEDGTGSVNFELMRVEPSTTAKSS